MKHLLITGFDPFGGEAVNPAWEAVRALPDTVGDFRLTKLEIPTVFGAAAKTVLETAAKTKPDVILCIGQAGGRDAITPERIAVNLMDASISDNRGFSPKEQPCIPGGPDAIFATVPARAMAEAANLAGIPARVSLSAGSFVCNDTLYRLLHALRITRTKVGFVHVPFLPQQAKGQYPAMELIDMARGLEAMICALTK